MEFSLDHGTELDTEKVETPSFSDLFENPVVPGQEPEITKQNTIVSALENQAYSLAMLIDDIQSVGGMNRSMAMEAAKIDESLGSVPLNRYSEFPTATRYTVSLESFSDKLREIVKKLVELIKKGIDYLIFKMTGNIGKKADESIVKLYIEKQRKDMARARAAADTSEADYAELKITMRRLVSLTPYDIKEKTFRYTNILEEALRNTPNFRAAYQLLSSGNQLVTALSRRESDYAALLLSMPKTVSIAADQLYSRISKLKDLFDNPSFAEARFVASTMALKIQPDFAFKQVKYVTEDIPELLRTRVSKLPEPKPFENLDDLLSGVNKIFSDGKMDKYAEDLGTALFTMFQIRAEIEDVQAHVGFLERQGVESRVVNESTIELISQFNREATALNSAINFLDNQKHQLQAIAFDTTRIINNINKVLRERYTEKEFREAKAPPSSGGVKVQPSLVL